MKYPKLASITRLVETAYIHTAQFVKIRKPDIKSTSNIFLSLIKLKNIFHFEKNKVVNNKVIVVYILL